MASKLQYINSEQKSLKQSNVVPTTEQSLKTKDQLIEKIKEWVKIDNDIRILQKEQTKRRLEKKRVSTELMEVMRSNGIDAFDINDGQIIYDKRNTKKPITKTMLMTTLSSYFNGDTLKASEINQYILDNREEVVKERIMRKITSK
jgi:predicted XRE-type DNA-binding protein